MTEGGAGLRSNQTSQRGGGLIDEPTFSLRGGTHQSNRLVLCLVREKTCLPLSLRSTRLTVPDLNPSDNENVIIINCASHQPLLISCCSLSITPLNIYYSCLVQFADNSLETQTRFLSLSVIYTLLRTATSLLAIGLFTACFEPNRTHKLKTRIN